MTNGDDLITVTEAAARAGLSGDAIRRRIRRGELTAYTRKRNRRVQLVHAADIDAMEELTLVEPIHAASQNGPPTGGNETEPADGDAADG